jgi:hypothetical protein
MIPIMCITLTTWALSILIVTTGLPYRDPYANSFYYKLQEYQPRINVLQQIDQEFHLSNEPEILFLGDGLASYIIHAKSYLRYFYPLPLQRAQYNPKLIQTEVYQETLNAALNYQGKYIYLEPSWFDLDSLPAIKSKIDTEYEIVFRAKATQNSREVVLFERKRSSSLSERQ